ncbi:MAG: hypothetical protein KC549_04180 [Myxococcales bacterium]|nr:hypothetical protein [Myxococcales bacterium]
MSLDTGHLNQDLLTAGDHQQIPLSDADLARRIPVWSPEPERWQAFAGSPRSVPTCRPAYEVRYGADGVSAPAGAPLASPAPSVDVLALPLGDIVRRAIFAEPDRVRQPDGRLTCAFASLSLAAGGENMGSLDRRRYDFELEPDAVLQVYVGLSAQPVMMRCPNVQVDPPASFEVDGLFAGVGTFSPPSAERPRPSFEGQVALVGGGAAVPFGGVAPRDFQPAAPLSQGGKPTFVSSAILSAVVPYSAGAASLGYRPPGARPEEFLIKTRRVEDGLSATTMFPAARRIDEQFTWLLSGQSLSCTRVGFVLSITRTLHDGKGNEHCPGKLGFLADVRLAVGDGKVLSHRFGRVPFYRPAFVPVIFDELALDENTALPLCLDVHSSQYSVFFGCFSNLRLRWQHAAISCQVDRISARLLPRRVQS